MEWGPRAEIDRAADLTVGRWGLELLRAEISKGGMETTSVVDLDDEPRAL
jgi:hypothetical protein